jgi:hypothetical protein
MPPLLVTFGGEGDREAELLKPQDSPALGRLGGLFVGVSRTRFAVGLVVKVGL